MVQTLEDRGTYYVGPEVFRMESEDLQGNFEGIGAHVQMRLDGKLIIVAPLEGSPAMDAGIKAGDLVLEVDGESIEGLSLLEAVGKDQGASRFTGEALGETLGRARPGGDCRNPWSDTARKRPSQKRAGATGSLISGSPTSTQTPQSAWRRRSERSANRGPRPSSSMCATNPGGLLSAAIDVSSQFPGRWDSALRDRR